MRPPSAAQLVSVRPQVRRPSRAQTVPVQINHEPAVQRGVCEVGPGVAGPHPVTVEALFRWSLSGRGEQQVEGEQTGICIPEPLGLNLFMPEALRAT